MDSMFLLKMILVEIAEYLSFPILNILVHLHRDL
jgi:hypothetical protein